MRKRACETESVKNRAVVDRDISQEPAMRKLKRLYDDMTPEEKERTGDYLNDTGVDHGKA